MKKWLFTFILLSVSAFALIQPGDSLFVKKEGEHYWYPSVVLKADGDHNEILFRDGGDRKTVPSKSLNEMEVKIGTRVFARWQRANFYFPGTVVGRVGDQLTLQYDDGDREEINLSYIRIADDKLKNHCKVGEPVFALTDLGFWGSGYLSKIDNLSVEVQLSTGHTVRLGMDYIKPLKISVGEKVYARWKGLPFLFSGKTAKVEGDRVYIEYDDGDKEWTTSILVNIFAKTEEGQKPESHCANPNATHSERKIDIPKFSEEPKKPVQSI